MSGSDTRLASGPGGYGYSVVAAASIIMVLIFAVQYSFGVFFKPVLTEFGWTRAMTAGAFSLVWISQGLVSILMGDLNDRVGPRLVLTMCGTLIGTGFLLMAHIGGIWQLYLFYGVIVGAGLGGTFVPLTSTTARWFVARRGLMTGIVTAGVGVGAFIGPPIANALISTYDWRRSYTILGAVVLGGVLVFAQFLRRDPAEVGRTPLARGGASGAMRTVASGLSLREAVGSRMFWIVFAAFFCYGFSLQAIMLHLAPYATDLGISSTRAASILASIGGASIAGKVVLGMLADRIGNKHVYVASFVLMIAALLWLLAIRDAWALYGFAMLFGFAYGGLATAHSPLVAWLFGMKQHGLVFGVSFNGWTIGCAVGPIVAGYVFDVTHGYQMAFAICAAVASAGLVLTTWLSPVVPDGLPADGRPHAHGVPEPRPI